MNQNIRDQIVARMDELMSEYERLELALKAIDGSTTPAPGQVTLLRRMPDLKASALEAGTPLTSTQVVEYAVLKHPDGATRSTILDTMDAKDRKKFENNGLVDTILYRLVKQGRILSKGSHGAKHYYPPKK